jgi:G3E family GTPase
MMIKIDIFSGFLGAGKTTLIQKLIREAYSGEKVVLIENEFGEIGVDGGFLKDAGIEITEMNSGCICCSLVGDFSEALKEVSQKFSPDRIIIEPSGVGKLSDVIKAVKNADIENSELNAYCTVVDAKKCNLYLKNFGEFFLDQVKNASCIVLSHTSDAVKTETAAAQLKQYTSVTIVTTDWDRLDGKEILAAMQQTDSLKSELEQMQSEMHKHEHGDHCCHHGHDHEHEGHCCHHDQEHEHEHDGHCCHHDHEHKHEHDGHCCHHDHEHGHDGQGCHHEHHHHHADDVFSSWGAETAKKFTEAELRDKLAMLATGDYGEVLRAKGILDGANGWIYFDYVPEEIDVRKGASTVTGRLCVIGCNLNEEKLKELFLG